ncbi:MAG TPA: hypothetical protein VFE90_18005 [Myxococcales bacterium]|jgi:hypothetical protein|nr:hypothetical protein [Myxococcales bacterium]
MKRASRVSLIAILLGLCPAAPASAQQRPAIADQIAKTYGLDSFGQIDAIRYTFNIDLTALKLKISRSWIWEPKTGQVSFEGKDKTGKPLKVTYTRSQVAGQDAVVKDQVDPAFINDQYWLLFPFHMVWDGSGAAVTDEGMQKLPLGKGSARKVVVKYAGGGYTPGDTWTLFVGKDNRVQEMDFRHGGAAKPSQVLATWAGYKKAGPLLVSTDHRGKADGKAVRVFFSGVAVKLSGSNDWVEAK